MSTRLDDFIRNHRDEFDSDVPPPEVWNKISDRVIGNPMNGKAKLVSLSWIRWSAAAAVLVLATVLAIYLFNGQKPASNPGLAQSDPKAKTAIEKDPLSDIDPAYAKELYHFTQLIELKQGELKQIENDNPQLYQQFVGEINKLDSSYNALKQELPANPNREQLLEAMIRNLQIQMDLLNQQLQVIQQIKQSKNKKNESNSKSI